MSAPEPLPEAVHSTASEAVEITDEHPFYDKALGDYLEQSETGELTDETINEAAECFRNGTLSANEFTRIAIGIPILVGHPFVQRGEVDKREVLEVSPQLVLSTAETTGKDYVDRLVRTAEAYWQDRTGPGQAVTVLAERREAYWRRERQEQELVSRFQDGDERAFHQISKEYEWYAKYLATFLYGPGLEREDIVQEARFGLVKGVRDYCAERGGLQAFLQMTMRRQVITAVKMSNRKKHGPLNDAVPLALRSDIDDDEGSLYEKTRNELAREPWEILAVREEIEALMKAVHRDFSEAERSAWLGLRGGLSYVEIGELLDLTPKQVDNALQRATRKLAAVSAEFAVAD